MDRLSPRSVALGHLIDMYCNYTPEQPEEDFPLVARQQLALILVQQVNGGKQSTSFIEPSCHATLDALVRLPRCFIHAFVKRLREMTEPDDLWKLMVSLSNLMEPELLAIDMGSCKSGPSNLDRSSVLGMFVRRLLLSFRRSTFESLCTLTTHFGQWVCATPPEAHESSDAHCSTSVADCGSSNGDNGMGTNALLPPWAHALPHKTLETNMRQMVERVEGGSPSVVEDLEVQLAQLHAYAPCMPQVHYLEMLRHMHARSFEAALSEFHR